eukprot:g1127.t1
MASGVTHFDGETTTYEYSGETTEWQDILVKKGIIEAPEKPERKTIFMADRVARAAPGAEEGQDEDGERDSDDDLLDELEDEMGDDEMLRKFREARIAEMQAARARDRFGEVRPIEKPEWVSEVTEASKDVWVVCYLWQHSLVECKLMDALLPQLAARHKYVKFVSIRSTAAVENWPDSRLPTLFMYHDGELQHTTTGLSQFGGKQMTLDSLEWRLAQFSVVRTELESDPAVTQPSCKLRRGYVDRRTAGGGNGDAGDIDDDN